MVEVVAFSNYPKASLRGDFKVTFRKEKVKISEEIRIKNSLKGSLKVNKKY